MQTNARVTAASVIQQQMEENADQWKREVEARQRRQTKARRQRIEERQRLKHLYRHETLEQKVSRMASHCWIEYDEIRRRVEEDLPLLRPTPARIRQRREWIARLVNDCRLRRQQDDSLPYEQTFWPKADLDHAEDERQAA